MTRRAPVLLVVLSTGAALLTAVVPRAALATTPVVSVTSDAADINLFAMGDFDHQTDPAPDVSESDFFRFAHHLTPVTETGAHGSGSAFVRQASTIETPAQPPFPVQPVSDIALDGLATSAATVGNTDVGGTPNSDSEGTFGADFELQQGVPAFFSGFLQTTQTDTDSCSYAVVDLIGPNGFSRHFEADSPSNCNNAGTRQKGWAEKVTLPAGEYELSADYYSEVDDTPDEAHSVSASSTMTFNLAFMPPTARFTTRLSGSTARFDAGSSSKGLAARPLARYLWTFGDGTKKTTTTATVSHTYPAAPSTAKTYKPSLQVVDDGGAVSAPVTHSVIGTATTLGVGRSSSRISAHGAVTPNRKGRQVAVTLARKSGGRFHNLATHHPTLSSTSRYSTAFARPARGTCRLTTRYPGDATHLASTRSRVVAC